MLWKNYSKYCAKNCGKNEEKLWVKILQKNHAKRWGKNSEKIF